MLEWAVDQGKDSETAAKYWDAFSKHIPLNVNNDYDAKKGLSEQSVNDFSDQGVRRAAENAINNATSQSGGGLESVINATEEGINNNNEIVGGAENFAKERDAKAKAAEDKRRKDTFNSINQKTSIPGVAGGYRNKEAYPDAFRLNSQYKNNYLKFLKRLTKGNDSMNDLAADFGILYMEENSHAWCDDRDNVPRGQSKNGTFQTNEEFYNRVMSDPGLAQKYNEAIYQIMDNTGVSYDEADNFMKNLPTLMRGTFVEYQGLRMTLERDKDAAVFGEINKSSAMAMISGDDTVQDALYKAAKQKNPDLTNDATVDLREFFTDRGKGHILYQGYK